MIKNLISYIVMRLVQKPENVEVDFENKSDFILVTIKVDQDDKGKVLGKDGNVIKSIRTIINSISAKKVRIKVGE